MLGPERFWVVDNIRDETSLPTAWQRDGVLVGIVDEDEGGIIAYCHEATADRLMCALMLLARAERGDAEC